LFTSPSIGGNYEEEADSKVAKSAIERVAPFFFHRFNFFIEDR
jgi:hypothetical protein